VKGRDDLGYMGVNVNIISEQFLEIRVGRCGLEVSGSGQGLVVGPCEHGNETSGSIKGWEFLV
jgi:hypothetical protein